MFKRAGPTINLGILFFAALLSDFLLGVFFWMGLETAFVPEDFPHLHFLNFTFPYSHGLVAAIGWSLVAAVASFMLWKRDRAKVAIIIAMAVFSHFILDGLVHVPGVPLAGPESPKVGLQLWLNMPLALSIEMILVVIGLFVYWPIANKNFSGKWGVLILMVLFSILTIFGMTATEPPDLKALGIGWLLAPVTLSVIALFLDWKNRHIDETG